MRLQIPLILFGTSDSTVVEQNNVVKNTANNN